MTLFSSHAIAYQYAYYSPHPYSAPRAYYKPYNRAPVAYYPAYRYPAQPGYEQAHVPAQAPKVKSTGVNADGQSAARNKSGSDIKPVSSGTTVNPDSSLSANKHEFISTLLPYIAKENQRLITIRQNIASTFNKLERNVALSSAERQEINKLSKKYRVNGNPLEDKRAREELLRKIDIIPASLALAQAVNESAWGKSRFAQQANNLFGIWTYDQDKGLKPLNREEGKTHLIRIFDDVGESVSYYMYTLNSHPAYKELREIRRQLRATGQAIDGHKLAAGLEKYSAKGQAYIDLIRSLIRQNRWVQLDTGNQRA